MANTAFKRVLLANINGISSYGIKNIIQSNIKGLDIEVYTAGEYKALLQPSEQVYDLIIMGVQNSFESTDILGMLTDKKIKSSQKILFLTDQYNDTDAFNFLKAGAVGYLNININSAEFLNAFKSIAAGNIFLLDSQARLLVKFIGKERTNFEDNLLSPLSLNEHKIMKLLIKGNRIKEIAQQLNLSTSTVGTYKTRVFRKLNITNIIELMQLLNAHNILLE